MKNIIAKGLGEQKEETILRIEMRSKQRFWGIDLLRYLGRNAIVLALFLRNRLLFVGGTYVYLKIYWCILCKNLALD